MNLAFIRWLLIIHSTFEFSEAQVLVNFSKMNIIHVMQNYAFYFYKS